VLQIALIIIILIIIIDYCMSSGDSRETSFLFQRLSIIVQRFNSVFIMDSFCATDEDPDL